ncbi:hypothetical protein FLJC2902T_15530 [Flavobacterium limnosediminis JC2902]|uniref:Uncharacterized protein n=1 Tax=Flavobacterium limnosediminis JC2902 TaxID=1341181 RepID=V6SNE6_9FLAO|nr:hypothetical protein FLJC2902T_15530 [Flavobacterium limnosediminis JC2902]
MDCVYRIACLKNPHGFKLENVSVVIKWHKKTRLNGEFFYFFMNFYG